MEILKPLLKLLGIPGRRDIREQRSWKSSLRQSRDPSTCRQLSGSRLAGGTPSSSGTRPLSTPMPMGLSQDQMPCRSTSIGPPSWRFQDGQIVWVPYDGEPGSVEVIREERLRNLGLCQGTKLHTDLQFLLPTRPPDAIACPDCKGAGKLPFPERSKHLADVVICTCGGIGWLPHGEKP